MKLLSFRMLGMILVACTVALRFPSGAVPRPGWSTSLATRGREVDRLRDGKRMRLSHADALSLQAIPGVGPTLAQRIVNHCKKQACPCAAHLRRVRGVGTHRARAMSPWLEDHCTSQSKLTRASRVNNMGSSRSPRSRGRGK